MESQIPLTVDSRHIFYAHKRWCTLLKLTPMTSYYDKTRIDVYETLCPQQMLVHEGGKIKNWGGECRDVTPTKSLSQNIRVDVNREVKFL